jgi:hypothetical protein
MSTRKNREQKLRKFLRDPMGPRAWIVGGVCAVAVRSLHHLLREQPQAWTSEPLIIIGAVMTVSGIAVEVVARLWLAASARRG